MDFHKNYYEKFSFGFRLLSDPDRKTTAAYNALKENGKSVRRTVYIIDKKGVVRYAKQGMPGNEELLEALDKL